LLGKVILLFAVRLKQIQIAMGHFVLDAVGSMQLQIDIARKIAGEITPKPNRAT